MEAIITCQDPSSSGHEMILETIPGPPGISISSPVSTVTIMQDGKDRAPHDPFLQMRVITIVRTKNDDRTYLFRSMVSYRLCPWSREPGTVGSM